MSEPRPPRFDVPVPTDGYHWWYIDALDDSGENGLVIIAFIGSVFSPYYFRARQQGRGVPEEFCAVNVGLYEGRSKRWCMTERKSAALSRTENRMIIGPSGFEWDDTNLVISLNERSAPLGRKIKGKIRIMPQLLSDRVFELDGKQRHWWHPWSVRARIEVEMSHPQVSWRGHAYLDSNWGAEPLENGFTQWDWSRSHTDEAVLLEYSSNRRDGSEHSMSLAFNASGDCQKINTSRAQTLQSSGWGIGRTPRSQYPLTLIRSLEDTPFYSRSLLQAETPEGTSLLVHESLSLDRFSKPWVRCLLPFRMPRKFF